MTITLLACVCLGSSRTAAETDIYKVFDHEAPTYANSEAQILSGAGVAITLVPVSASAGSIVGQTVSLPRGAHSLELEVRVGTWDPNNIGTLLKGFEADIDSSGYTSGFSGFLTPTIVSCVSDDDCLAAFGGVCTITGGACSVTDGCPQDPIEKCRGSGCGFPVVGPNAGTQCEPGFIFTGRPDYTFINSGGEIVAVDLTMLGYRYAGGVSAGDGVPPHDPFPPGGAYSGTVRLDTTEDCSGTFTVGFLPPPHSVLVNQNNQFIPMVTLVPAKIKFPAPTIEFRPVGGSGNEITVSPGSQVTLEAYVSQWSPDLLDAYQIRLDVASYSNGVGADLEPSVLGCTDDADCEAVFGSGATCNNLGQGLFCSPAFIDQTRGDYVFAGEAFAPAVDLGSAPDFRWASTMIVSSMADPGGRHYAASLVVDVPLNAEGTYTFGFDPSPDTALVDDQSGLINAQHVPAKIHVGSCGPSAAPVPEMAEDSQGTQVVHRKSRALSISGGDPGQLQAIRVTFADLPPPFDTWNGTELWVGEPFGVCELPGQNPTICQPSSTRPGYLAASLQCDPFIMDWTLLRGFCSNGICHGSSNAGDTCATHDDCPDAVIHIQHEAIVPSTLATTTGPIDHHATYDVQIVNALCDMGAELNYSAALPMTTSGWADLAAISGGGFRPPDDVINVFDIAGVFQKFIADPLAPSKAIVDFVGASAGPEAKLDHLITTLELVFVLDAFGGGQYPFSPEPTPNCP